MSDVLNVKGCPYTKVYNASASKWLSEKEVRLREGNPKAHFGTIVIAFWGAWGGGGGWRFR